MMKNQVQILGQKDPLEKEMAMHSSILAWRIPRTEEPSASFEVDTKTELSVPGLFLREMPV